MAGVVYESVLALEVSCRAFCCEVCQRVEYRLALVHFYTLEYVSVVADDYVCAFIQCVVSYYPLIVGYYCRSEVDAPVLGNYQYVYLRTQLVDVLDHVVEVIYVRPAKDPYRSARLVVLYARSRGDAAHGVCSRSVDQRPVILRQYGAVSEEAYPGPVVEGPDHRLSGFFKIVSCAYDVDLRLLHYAHGIVEAFEAPVHYVVSGVGHNVEAGPLKAGTRGRIDAQRQSALAGRSAFVRNYCFQLSEQKIAVMKIIVCLREYAVHVRTLGGGIAYE